MANFKEIIKNSWRYAVVVLIFVFAFFFMKNFVLNTDQDHARQIKNLEDKSENLQNQTHVISKDQSEARIENFLSSKKGDMYRISYQVQKTDLVAKVENDSVSKIEIALEDNSGNSKTLGTKEVMLDSQFRSQDFVFETDGGYRDLVFRRNDDNDRSQIEFKNVKISRLNCPSIGCAKTLTPTIYGDNYGISEDQAMLLNAEPIYKYDYSNKNFGQIFKPTANNITSVSLSFRIIGDGGSGSLIVNLSKATKDGDKFVVSEDRLSAFSFSMRDIAKYQIAQDIYSFPLSVYVDPAEYYFVGISNEKAESNFFHTIRMLGASDSASYPDGRAKLVGSNKTYGDLYFKTEHKSDYFVDNTLVLLNASIEDLGGESTYSYSYSESANDFFDIFEMSEDAIARPYLDTGSKSITAQSFNDAFFTYKFDTLEPFKKIQISYEQISGHNINAVGYYSFDNMNWVKIEEVLPDNRNAFVQNLDHEGTSQVFVKFTYDKNDIGKQNNIFGIRNLEVNATINGK